MMVNPYVTNVPVKAIYIVTREDVPTWIPYQNIVILASQVIILLFLLVIFRRMKGDKKQLLNEKDLTGII